jgi:23S rRNA (cytidine1920-2'-O)/16S rRNA (cytidine1409-2'-O)-methyltransferase
MSEKIRLDVLLHLKEHYDSREKARRAIMAGNVMVDGELVDKAGTKVALTAHIQVKAKDPYVSRGGFKLEKALSSFDLELVDLVCMDIGASTGGFTDCMLQSGARRVYAIDVGYGQLDWRLRNDPRVVVMERTNFRILDTSLIEDVINFFSVDVSFISLKHIFPNVLLLSNPESILVTLIKPQFEAGRHQVGKHGLVKDPKIHLDVIQRVAHFAQDNAFKLVNLSYSPIRGAKGNIEYIACFSREDSSSKMIGITEMQQVINLAFDELNN